MADLLQHVRMTLAEEATLLDSMIDLAQDTREALVQRSVQKLLNLTTRHQNAIIRLQILRKSLESIVNTYTTEAETESLEKGSGMKGILRHLHAEEEMEQLNNVEEKLKELNDKNFINEQLVNKQSNSLGAFQQLLDLVNGVDKVYDRSGELSKIESDSRIEQTG